MTEAKNTERKGEIKKRKKRKGVLKIKRSKNIEDKEKDLLLGTFIGFMVMVLALFIMIIYHHDNIENYVFVTVTLGLFAGLVAKKSFYWRIGIGVGMWLPFLPFEEINNILLIFLFFTGSFLTGLLLSYLFHFFYSQLIKKLKSLSDFNER